MKHTSYITFLARCLSTVACLLCLLFPLTLRAQERQTMSQEEIREIADKIELDDDIVYYIRLYNGDILTGPIREISVDSGGTSIRVAAPIGRAKVYLTEVAWIGTYESMYRHSHRLYIMPTAEPIGSNHFVGLWELLFLYGGVGIGEVVSITAGRSFVPQIGSENQASIINLKATVAEQDNGLVEGGKQFYAIGATAGWLGDVNFMGHVYGVATFTGKRTRVSTMMFAKISGDDLYVINGATLFNPFTFPYATGTIGVALGLDTRFSSHHDMRFIAELWNADITRPSNTILMLGARLANTSLSMDFGMMVTPGPGVLPVVNVAWTP